MAMSTGASSHVFRLGELDRPTRIAILVVLLPLDVAHHSGMIAHRSDLISPAIPRLSRPPFRDDVARGDEASSGSDTVPPFSFAKGDLDADGEVAMRHVREVMRLKSAGMSTREIARRVGRPLRRWLTIRRFEAAGLTWPLSGDITDTELEARLFASAGAGPGTRRGHRRQAEPDWASVHRELKRKHFSPASAYPLTPSSPTP
jgi:hypothetical protein